MQYAEIIKHLFIFYIKNENTVLHLTSRYSVT